MREFLSSRRQRPEGTEGHVLALGPAFRKLKASRERATTLYEAQPLEVDFQDPELPFPGVVWLVAYGYRKEGDADDAYRGFERIGADAMRPVEEDYALLAEDLRLEAELSLRRDLEDGLRRLRDKARGEPGVLHRLDLDTVQPGVAFLIFEDGDLTLLIVPVVDSNRRARQSRSAGSDDLGRLRWTTPRRAGCAGARGRRAHRGIQAETV